MLETKKIGAGVYAVFKDGEQVTGCHTKIEKIYLDRDLIVAVNTYGRTRALVYFYTGDSVIIVGAAGLIRRPYEEDFKRKNKIEIFPDEKYYSNPRVFVAGDYVFLYWEDGHHPRTFSDFQIISLKEGKLVGEELNLK